jgi:hypothetical protein
MNRLVRCSLALGVLLVMLGSVNAQPRPPAPPLPPIPTPPPAPILLRDGQPVTLKGRLQIRPSGSRVVVILTQLQGNYAVEQPPADGSSFPQTAPVKECALACRHALVDVVSAAGTSLCEVDGYWGYLDVPALAGHGLTVQEIRTDWQMIHVEQESHIAELLAVAIRKVTAYVLAQPGHQIADKRRAYYLGNDKVKVIVPEIFGDCGTPSGMWYRYDGATGVVTPW